MKIIVGDGKVSRVLRRPGDVVLSHAEIDITDEVETQAKILRRALGRADGHDPVVVNTAAKINLEWCEENKEACYAVNTLGTLKLARACDVLGLRFVHVSSGCVFDGMETGRVFTESDAATPACFYASSKAIADTMLLEAGLDRAPLILRPRQLVSARPHPTNMLTKFVNLPESARFIDVQNSLTCVEDFAAMVDHLILRCADGIYNCANAGTMSPLEVARSLRPLRSGWEPRAIAYEEYLGTIGVKRVNAILDTSKLEATGFVPRSARAAVEWCVENYGKNV